MRKLWLTLAAILTATISFGADTAGQSGLIFKLTFKDKSLIADVAAGEKTPAKQDNVTFAEGKGGTAAVFKDGAALAYKSAGNFNPAAGTLMMWIKPGANCETMFTMGQWYKDNFLTLRISSKFSNTHVALKKGGTFAGQLTVAKSPDKDVWHHYALTWSDGSMKLYLDGALVASSPLSDTWAPGGMPKEMWIGSAADGIYSADSAISDFRIYNRALSPGELLNEVSELKKGQIAGTQIAAIDSKKRKYNWKDWNSKPTPEEGRSVDELYDFNKYVICDGNFHRLEFNLDKKVKDAYLIYGSHNGTDDRHTVKVNGQEILSCVGNEVRTSGVVIVKKIDNLKQGANAVSLNGCWVALEVVINLEDGTQLDFTAGPGWRSADSYKPGWDLPGYKGPSEELHYRLGHEGYHQQNNTFHGRQYVGLIKLDDSKNNYPVYQVGETMNWTVSIPENFYGSMKPELKCTLLDAFDGNAPVSFSGKLINTENGMAKYELRYPLSRQGAFTAELSFGDRPAMKRRAELIVFGSLNQPETTADNIFSELKKTLIDQIDCTKPDNPENPVILGGPPGSVPLVKIVDNNGLKYLQTGSEAGFLAPGYKNNYAMWKLKVEKLNQFYLAEIDIPDDKDRVQIIALVHGSIGYEFGTETTVETGRPRPLSGKMITHRLLFIPKFNDVRIMISPVQSSRQNNGAAMAAIRFYRIDGLLPAVKLGDSRRESANYNERVNLPGISYYPGSDGMQRFSGRGMAAENNYRRWYLALRNHVQILRMSAQNAVCNGLYMYVREEYPTKPEQTDFVRLMQDMYGANGINFYGNSEYFSSSVLEGKDVGHRIEGTKVSDKDVQSGTDTYRLVSRDGKQAPNYPMNNPLHPTVKADMIRVFEDIGRKYAIHKNFKGMMVFEGTMGCAMAFRSLDWGYDDYSYRLFREKFRNDAPEFQGVTRFRQRYDWIMKSAKEDFINFRCREIYELNRAALVALRKYSPQAKLLVNICAWPWHGNIGNGSVAELKQKLLEMGTDPKLYLNDPDMLVLHNDWMGAHMVTDQDLALAEKYNRDPAIWEYLTGGKPCGVFFWTGYYETSLSLPPEMLNQYWLAEKWFFMLEKRFIGSAGKLGRNYLSAYTNALAYADPVIYLNRFTDVAEHRGFIDMKAEAGEAISYIPAGIYQTAPGSDTNIVLRCSGDNAYLVNNQPYPSKVQVQFGNNAKVKTPINGQNLRMENGSAAFELKPYQTIPLRLDSASEVRILKKNMK